MDGPSYREREAADFTSEPSGRILADESSDVAGPSDREREAADSSSVSGGRRFTDETGSSIFAF
jgi:hypothetical protein